jgi:hypothetical protein
MTDTYELPALPERFAVLPKLVLPDVHGMGGNTTVFQQQDAYTADQMQEYARLAVRQERGRCAKLCESLDAGLGCEQVYSPTDIAAAIRGGST